jgi:hypothetical protein
MSGIVTEDGTTKISNNSISKDLIEHARFMLDGERLYNLALHDNYGTRTIIIDITDKGFQLYTFTFG